MHFQLYIPGKVNQDPAILDEVGLADFRTGAEFLPVAEGPLLSTENSELKTRSRPGVIIAWRKPGKVPIGYQPGVQTWFPAFQSGELEAGRYWVGLWSDQPVTPADLARPYGRPGSRVTLGDGQEWTLPAAKELPADAIQQDDGSWRFEIQRQFHAFYLEYLRWLELFATAQEGTEYDYGEAAQFVLQGLRINYRLLPEVASRLRLLSTDNITRSLFAILGASG